MKFHLHLMLIFNYQKIIKYNRRRILTSHNMSEINATVHIVNKYQNAKIITDIC